ncbi:MAG: superoxide dismutase [Proteobacteria bacterium]|nr:superoxide dismutase [Pseudomonadota bacterium]
MDRRTFLAGAVALAGTAALAGPGWTLGEKPEKPTSLELPPLPYRENALEPYLSANTLSLHYGKHHAGYVARTQKAIQGTSLESQPLEAIIAHAAAAPDSLALFQNAAQAWNHNFLWKSMKPGGGGKPPEGSALAMAMDAAFGGFENFADQFAQAANGQFGSGWAWLVADAGVLSVVTTSNADTPLTRNQTPLLTLDVWEHAYYLDYQNRRAEYVQNFLNHLANWTFAAENLAGG